MYLGNKIVYFPKPQMIWDEDALYHGSEIFTDIYYSSYTITAVCHGGKVVSGYGRSFTNYENAIPMNEVRGVCFGETSYGHAWMTAGRNNGRASVSYARSYNLGTWTEAKNLSDDSSNLYDIEYGEDIFVAVGYDGFIGINSAIFISENGLSWGKQDITYSGDTSQFKDRTLKSVAYAPDKTVKFVCVGNNGTIVTTTDCETWTMQSLGTVHFNDVIYADNKFTAVGYYNSRGTTPVEGAPGTITVIATSSDGLTWTLAEIGENTPKSVAYNNGTYVIVQEGDRLDGYTITSGINGESKTLNNIGTAIRSEILSKVIAVGDCFVSISSDKIIKSKQGELYD